MPINYAEIAGQYGGKKIDEIASEFGGTRVADQERPRFAQTQETAQIQVEGQDAEEFLKKPWYKQLFTKQVKEELPTAALQVGVETPAKFLASAAEVPGILRRGKEGIEEGRGLQGYQATGKEYNIPGIKPFKSYISEAENRAGDIVEGKKPLYTAAAPFAAVPLAGMETAGLAKGIGQVGKLGARGVSALRPQSYKKLLAETTERKIMEATAESAEKIKTAGAKTALDIATKEKTSAIQVARKARDLELVKQVKKDYSLPESYREAYNKVKTELPLLGKKIDSIAKESKQKIDLGNITNQLQDLAKQKKSIGQDKAAQELIKLKNRILKENKNSNFISLKKSIDLKRQLDEVSIAISKAAQRGEKISGSKDTYYKVANLFRNEIHKISPEVEKLDAQYSAYAKVSSDLKKMNTAEELAELTLNAEKQKAKAITLTAKKNIEQKTAAKINELQAKLIEDIKRDKIIRKRAFRNRIMQDALIGGIGYSAYRLFSKK